MGEGCNLFISTVPPPETVVVTASRAVPLYEGTTGLEIRCEVTPKKTGVDTNAVVTRVITPGGDGDRVISSPLGETLSISILALRDDGLYTCTASTGSEVNSTYILTSLPTQGVYTLMVTSKCVM